jgi:hypothetical protein
VNGQKPAERKHAVWARKRVVWKELGGVNALEIDAKTADALMILEQVWREETKDGEV